LTGAKNLFLGGAALLAPRLGFVSAHGFISAEAAHSIFAEVCLPIA
jgi:hypothetical protein